MRRGLRHRSAVSSSGEVARFRQDFRLAEKHYTETLDIFRQIGDTAASVSVLHNLAYTASNLDNPKKADALFREALTIARDLKDQLGIFSMLGGLACVATALGQQERAVQMFGAAEVVGKAGGYVGDRVDQEEVKRQLEAARSVLDSETIDVAWTRGQNMSPEEAIAFALSEQEPNS